MVAVEQFASRRAAPLRVKIGRAPFFFFGPGSRKIGNVSGKELRKVWGRRWDRSTGAAAVVCCYWSSFAIFEKYETILTAKLLLRLRYLAPNTRA